MKTLLNFKPVQQHNSISQSFILRDFECEASLRIDELNHEVLQIPFQ